MFIASYPADLTPNQLLLVKNNRRRLSVNLLSALAFRLLSFVSQAGIVGHLHLHVQGQPESTTVKNDNCNKANEWCMYSHG
jgi:hypothetical protein